MAITNVFSADQVIRQMEDVIKEENERHILKSCHLRHLELLLLHATAHFRSQPEAVQETLKIWLQLVHNSLVHAESIFHRSQQSPISYLDCFKCSRVGLSEEIKEWKALFNCLCKGLLTEFLKFVSDYQFVIDPVIQPTDPVIQVMKDVIREEDNRHILQTDLGPLNNHLLDVTHILEDQQELARDILLDPQDQQDLAWDFLLDPQDQPELARDTLRDPQDQLKLAREIMKIWLQLLNKCLEEAKTILHRYDPPQRQQCLYSLVCNPGRLSDQLKDWKVLFNYLFQGFTVCVLDIIGLNSITKRNSLSKDEAWMLFKIIAFKNSPVSMDIEESAKDIVEECRGLPLPITLVAAAMIGKNSVDEWKSCLSSIKINEDPSFPDIHPPLVDKHLYQQIRWCYDALPNSNVQNCFFYCAMYPRDEYPYHRYLEINVEELVQTWIAEGLVKSKEGSHLMDMAIGRTYINLLIHRCFFQNATVPPKYKYKDKKNVWYLRDWQRIRVADVIRDVAIFIGEKEEKCVFQAGQGLHNFPEIENEECKRISVRRNNIENLPSEFRRPKLVSLFLSLNPIREVPSGFLVTLASLKVLHLSKYWGSNEEGITSIPSSIGQLKQLEFLDLNYNYDIKDLPKEIGQLSSLQFLNMSYCLGLQSLPPEIGGLTNLKSLDLSECGSLRVIPDEISQLTSLNKLDMMGLKQVSESSIWNMKDLRNLTMLRIYNISSPIKVGIMGNWLEMRHLCLDFQYGYSHELPHDMQKMSKLQSFIMCFHDGLSLPDHTFKFQHLQYIELLYCRNLKELSPLERLPNLKYLELDRCDDLKELGIGKSGRASGFLMLEKLVLIELGKLQSIAGACNNGVWNEKTLPGLRTMMIRGCPDLKRLPVGMEKLLSLRNIIGEQEWWQTLIWGDESMKIHLQNLFTASDPNYFHC